LCAFLGIFYVYIAELFPTRVRSIGFGWASLVGTVGRLISPRILALVNKAKIYFWLLSGVFGIGGFLSLMVLKETFGKPMEDEIDEIRILKSMEVLNEGIHSINI
jgi:MFS family permease